MSLLLLLTLAPALLSAPSPADGTVEAFITCPSIVLAILPVLLPGSFSDELLNGMPLELGENDGGVVVALLVPCTAGGCKLPGKGAFRLLPRRW